jgi:malonyl-CoA O-methyltransferase
MALQCVRDTLRPTWWQLARRAGSSVVFSPPPAPVQMLWSNMALHMSADPQALLQQWLSLLQVDGFLMFSCLGPDTLAQLRGLYQNQGWPAPAHQFTDMHDWGDMLVRSGFAEPVMDMEKITLTFSSPESLLTELRGLGRNLYRGRFGGLRGRRWLADLHRALESGLAPAAPDGRMQLSFEIIYGHAIKPAARLPVRAHSSIALQDFRAALAAGKSASGLS